jgi:hypothetical protein
LDPRINGLPFRMFAVPDCQHTGRLWVARRIRNQAADRPGADPSSAFEGDTAHEGLNREYSMSLRRFQIRGARRF